jgi:hypothetical protein
MLEPKDYDAYWDAQTLMKAEAMKADEARMNKSRPYLEELLKEKDAQAKALKKLTKKKKGGAL